MAANFNTLKGANYTDDKISPSVIESLGNREGKMKKIILFAIAMAGLLVFRAAAQQPAVERVDNYTFTTNPPGATAYLHGEYDLVVNTPANLPSDLSGKYRVKITRPGYESWSGELSFMPGSPNSVNINLSKKTRFKAGLRSLFIPGWGQHYSGNSARGAAFTVGTIAAAGVLLYADKRYRDRRDTYKRAYQNYLNAPSIDERTRLFAVYSTARDAASRAETDRRRIFYAGVGIWVYNIFDSMIFFSDRSTFFPVVNATDDGGAGLSFVVKF